MSFNSCSLSFSLLLGLRDREGGGYFGVTFDMANLSLSLSSCSRCCISSIIILSLSLASFFSNLASFFSSSDRRNLSLSSLSTIPP